MKRAKAFLLPTPHPQGQAVCTPTRPAAGGYPPREQHCSTAHLGRDGGPDLRAAVAVPLVLAAQRVAVVQPARRPQQASSRTACCHSRPAEGARYSNRGGNATSEGHWRGAAMPSVSSPPCQNKGKQEPIRMHRPPNTRSWCIGRHHSTPPSHPFSPPTPSPPQLNQPHPPDARVVGCDEQLAGLGGQELQPRHLLATRVLPPLIFHVCNRGVSGWGSGLRERAQNSQSQTAAPHPCCVRAAPACSSRLQRACGLCVNKAQGTCTCRGPESSREGGHPPSCASYSSELFSME